MNTKLDTFIDKYKESHQNKTNILIHKICVPLIVFSLLGILQSLPRPLHELNFAYIAVIIFLIYYFYLSIKHALIMTFQFAIMLSILFLLESINLDLKVISIAIFVLAWIGQFVGHKIEGKKPSFFDDLKFLFIGPLWSIDSFVKKVWKA